MSEIIDIQEKDEILESLKTLGLSWKESLVYLSLISLGEAGTSAISSDTKLHRQFVYDTLATLEEKDLVGHSVIRGRKRFFSNGPSRLSQMFEQKKQLADVLVSKIEKKFLPVDIQQFEIYRGQESVTANELVILKSLKKDSKILVLGGAGDQYSDTLGKYFIEYEYQRSKKNAEVLYLGSASQMKYLIESKENRKLFSYRVLPTVLTGELTMSIYEDRVCFEMFGNPVAVFVVKSKKIAKSYYDFFMGLWEISK